MRSVASLPGIFVAALAAACGGGGSPTTPPPAANQYVFTITTGGVTPRELTVPQGARVLFVNNDSRRRNMTSDPHPEHNDPGCEGINNVGLLNSGQSRETGNLVVIRTCGFHDHDDPTDASVRGRIIVTQ
jgi:hypothetical protein